MGFLKIGTKKNIEKQKETKEKNKIDTFAFLKCISSKDLELKNKLLPFIKTSKYSQFMINKYFAQYPYQEIIRTINILKIPNQMHFEMLLKMIPKGNGFVEYQYSKGKKDNNKVTKMDALSWKFYEKRHILSQYMNIISDEEMKEIINEYKLYLKMHKKKK